MLGSTQIQNYIGKALSSLDDIAKALTRLSAIEEARLRNETSNKKKEEQNNK